VALLLIENILVDDDDDSCKLSNYVFNSSHAVLHEDSNLGESGVEPFLAKLCIHLHTRPVVIDPVIPRLMHLP
jgi:hypothetical protein